MSFPASEIKWIGSIVYSFSGAVNDSDISIKHHKTIFTNWTSGRDEREIDRIVL
jgi:uncharacterized membrane-anchored protein